MRPLIKPAPQALGKRMQHKSLQLLITDNHPCSYLPGRQAKTAFVDPNTIITSHIYNSLSQQGFRRSGQYFYKPTCDACSACISYRVVCENFKPSRSQKRLLNTNKDLRLEWRDEINAPIFYKLYASYINLRHVDGDMYPPSIEQYLGFLNNAIGNTRYACFYLGEQLVAVAVIDVLQEGLAAVYSFYDAGLEKRSLGSFLIVFQIQEAQRLGLPHVYLGYWVDDCQKMAYKKRFGPAEILQNGVWQALS